MTVPPGRIPCSGEVRLALVEGLPRAGVETGGERRPGIEKGS
jgi:hypothetical protein